MLLPSYMLSLYTHIHIEYLTHMHTHTEIWGEEREHNFYESVLSFFLVKEGLVVPNSLCTPGQLDYDLQGNSLASYLPSCLT